MDSQVPLSLLIGLELGEYLIKTINFYRDTRNPTPCDSGLCSFIHSLYRTDKAKILLGLPFPADVYYAYREYQKTLDNK